MPGENLARRIFAEFPETRIVAITSAQGLGQAIRKVRAGGRVIPRPAAEMESEALSACELQVLQLAACRNGGSTALTP